jgi:HK97 gp10 family phage protein
LPIDEDNFDEFMLRIRGASAVALNEAAVEAEGYARRSMQRIPPRITKAGVFFGKRMKGGKEVYPGAPPGTFPGVRTSNLRNSMSTSTADAANLVSSFGVYGGGNYQAGARAGGPHVTVKGTGTRGYAGYLEFGTSKMKARPWATPTMAGAPIAKVFESSIRREMARGT